MKKNSALNLHLNYKGEKNLSAERLKDGGMRVNTETSSQNHI